MTERVTGTYEAISMMRAVKRQNRERSCISIIRKEKSRQEPKCSAAKANFSRLKFDHPVLEVLDEYGKVPLPPIFSMPLKNPTKAVIRRSMPSIPVPLPHRRQGSTSRMNCFSRFADKGCEEVFVTLHVGAGTFQPVRVENLSEHVMHSEWYSISPEAAEKINKAKAEGRRVVCVGTTSLRTVEATSLPKSRKARSGQKAPIRASFY